MFGFPQDALKYAFLSHFIGDFNSPPHLEGGLERGDYEGHQFYIVDQDDSAVVFSGSIAKRTEKTYQDYREVLGNVTKADVWECDFS